MADGHALAERLVLPVDGSYTIILSEFPVGPPVPETRDLQLSHDFDAGPIAPGVTALPADLAPGQSIAYTYAGSAGEGLWIRTLHILPVPSCDGTHPPGVYPNVTQTVYAPDGARFACTSGVDDGVNSWLRYEIPVGGTYRIIITPTTGSLSFDVGVQSFPA